MSLLCLLISLVIDIIANLFILPAKSNALQEENPTETSADEERGFETAIQSDTVVKLQKIPLYGFFLRHGSLIFFVAFGLFLMTAMYLENYPLFWMGLCIPALIFLYFIENLLSILVATLLMRSTIKEDSNGV
jgi:hypothetical protein